MALESLGATAAVSAAFESLRAQGLLPGRVAQAQCEQYILATGTEELEAEVSGAFRFHSGESMGLPVVGDWVAARPAGAGRGIIEAVLPRRTCFAPRAAGGRELRQAIAANIDVAFLVCGLDHDFNLRRVERYLALT